VNIGVKFSVGYHFDLSESFIVLPGIQHFSGEKTGAKHKQKNNSGANTATKHNFAAFRVVNVVEKSSMGQTDESRQQNLKPHTPIAPS
jgi:hypothetical protein